LPREVEALTVRGLTVDGMSVDLAFRRDGERVVAAAQGPVPDGLTVTIRL